MDELLPCPFCGCDVVRLTDDGGRGQCARCGAFGAWGFNSTRAIDAWNRRAPVKTETTEDARTKETTA